MGDSLGSIVFKNMGRSIRRRKGRVSVRILLEITLLKFLNSTNVPKPASMSSPEEMEELPNNREVMEALVRVEEFGFWFPWELELMSITPASAKM